jgi:transposase-like protein
MRTVTGLLDPAAFMAAWEAGVQRGPDLAARFGVTERTITRWKITLGLSTPSPLAGRRVTPEDRAAIEALLEEGMSFAEIERTTGWKHQTLQRHFPGRAWTPEQCGEHARAIRTANARIRKAYS